MKNLLDVLLVLSFLVLKAMLIGLVVGLIAIAITFLKKKTKMK